VPTSAADLHGRDNLCRAWYEWSCFFRANLSEIAAQELHNNCRLADEEERFEQHSSDLIPRNAKGRRTKGADVVAALGLPAGE